MATHPMLWTIGHSTRSSDAFMAALRAWRIEQLADVRSIPRSRHNPQFNAEALTADMTRAGMIYVRMPGLGGLRKPWKDSFNKGWRNASFRGYADYMQTDQFATSLEALMTEAARRRTAIMCAEAVPWRCHRLLIADTLLSRGWAVYHILSDTNLQPHTLTPFAKLESGTVTYPAPSNSTETPSLF
ncbi:MAG: hypothetical protein NTNFB02_09300 [Nitrospira sp.]